MLRDTKMEVGLLFTWNVNSMNFQRFNLLKEKKPSPNGATPKNLKLLVIDALKTMLKCATGENGLSFMINASSMKFQKFDHFKEVMQSQNSVV